MSLVGFPALLTVISDPTRWRILSELIDSNGLIVAEIAELIGATPDRTSKHLAVLRDAGIVTLGRNRLYQLRPEFIADKTKRIVDFGYCLLRLKTVP